jgi:uncharacterized repeat protein (TIGR01451 family)
MTIARHVKNAGLALLALSSVGALQSAFAAGTPAGTTISNQATVDYSVGSVAQTQITSAVVSFVVDNRIRFTAVRLNPAAPITARPNELNVVATFTVTNTGNAAQSYQLIASDPTNLTVFGNAESAPLEGALNLVTAWDANNDGDYDLGEESTGTGDVAPDATVRVFVLADIPATAVDGQFASIRLTARTALEGSNGATIADEDNGPDVPTGLPQIVWADTGEDNSESVDNQYSILSAALTLNKTATVISDDFNGTTNPKAIPNAVVQYTITVTNNSTTTDASAVTVTDNIPANATFVAGSITLNAGSVPDGTAFQNGPPARVVVNAGAVAQNGGTATVTFRVRIN